MTGQTTTHALDPITVEVIGAALSAMETSPEDETKRLRFYERLAE